MLDLLEYISSTSGQAKGKPPSINGHPRTTTTSPDNDTVTASSKLDSSYDDDDGYDAMEEFGGDEGGGEEDMVVDEQHTDTKRDGRSPLSTKNFGYGETAA